jgi:hypothetical protein
VGFLLMDLTVPPAYGQPPPGRDIPTSAQSAAAICERTLKIVHSHCSVSTASLDRCQTSEKTRTLMSPDHRLMLGPGRFVHFGNPGPEWFLRDDGKLVMTNGFSSSYCKDLPDVTAIVAEYERRAAPERGATVKTYECVWDAAGKFRFPDCSRFEIWAGSIIYRELWRKKDEDEDIALRRAAKKTGGSSKLMRDIYTKTTTACFAAISVVRTNCAKARVPVARKTEGRAYGVGRACTSTNLGLSLLVGCGGRALDDRSLRLASRNFGPFMAGFPDAESNSTQEKPKPDPHAPDRQPDPQIFKKAHVALTERLISDRFDARSTEEILQAGIPMVRNP